MQSLYNLIITITESPELYIGKKSIQRFHAFIGGFLYQNNGANDHCLDGFDKYVAEYYSIHSSHNWASIIEFHSNSGEEEIALFKKLFYEFTHSTAGQGTVCVNPIENMRWSATTTTASAAVCWSTSPEDLKVLSSTDLNRAAIGRPVSISQ